VRNAAGFCELSVRHPTERAAPILIESRRQGLHRRHSELEALSPIEHGLFQSNSDRLRDKPRDAYRFGTFINRAGTNLSPTRRRIMIRAKDELRKAIWGRA
jgi:hypothetical protein